MATYTPNLNLIKPRELIYYLAEYLKGDREYD